MAGLFGNFLSDDPGSVQPSGGFGSSMGALSHSQKLGLLFAGLRDAANGFSGVNTDYGAQQGAQTAQQNQMSARQAVNAKIQAAYASGDMNAVRAALVEAAGVDPESVRHITQAMQFGQPKVQDIGGAGYSIPTIGGGVPTKIIEGKPDKPLISGGMQSVDNGKTWAPIPNYVQQQRDIAGARRAPPKLGAVAPFGNPAALFGAR